MARRLSSFLEPDFSQATRNKGEAYAQAGRCLLFSWTDTKIVYGVRGGGDYRVVLEREADAVDCSCSCPRFADGYPCKHIWAAALSIERDPKWDGSWLQGEPIPTFDGPPNEPARSRSSGRARMRLVDPLDADDIEAELRDLAVDLDDVDDVDDVEMDDGTVPGPDYWGGRGRFGRRRSRASRHATPRKPRVKTP